MQPHSHTVSPRRLVLGIGLVWSAAAWAPVFASTPSGCPYDRPCIRQTYSTTSGGVFVSWSATESFSVYNVRWSRAGRDPTQVEVAGGRSGSFHLKNAHARTTYRFAIQGCSKRPLQSSRCSDWEDVEFKTR